MLTVSVSHLHSVAAIDTDRIFFWVHFLKKKKCPVHAVCHFNQGIGSAKRTTQSLGLSSNAFSDSIETERDMIYFMCIIHG